MSRHRRPSSKRVQFYAASGFVLVTMFGLLMLLSIFSSYTEGRQLNETLAAQHAAVTPTPPPRAPYIPPPPEVPYEPVEEVYVPETFPLPYGVTLPEVDFEALWAINPAVVGWIVLEGTPINLPVVQGENNYHYLSHLLDGRRNASGTLFIDSYNRPDFADHNTIIYGHNMQNGSMFAAIRRFRTQEFFDAHPQAFFLTPDGSYVIRFFAGHTTCVTSPSWRLEFEDDAAFEAWLAENRELSDFASDVAVGPRDRVVTLATCTTSREYADARYVLLGRLMPIG